MKTKPLFTVGLAIATLFAPTLAHAEIHEVRVVTTGYL